MAFNQLEDSLVILAKYLRNIQTLLKEYIKTNFDEKLYNKYEDRIDDVIYGLNYDAFDCEALIDAMHINGDFD